MADFADLKNENGTTTRVVLLADTPWPLPDVVAKLVEASDILLDQKNYDGHGHETISAARDAAKEWLKQI